MASHEFIGVDVAMDWIDVCYLSNGRHERIKSTKQALAKFAKAANDAVVVLEASGGYERPLIDALIKAEARFIRVNPRQAREFARATGKLAKTDKVDAAILARMGKALDLVPSPIPDPDRVRLADLVARREDLVAAIQAERNRLGTSRDGWVRREIQRLVAILEDHLDSVEKEIARHIAASGSLLEQARRLRTAPGIGPALVAVILARLPELGRLKAKQIAALAGLAPQACDSGLSRGKRRVWGGRADIRRAIYLAGFVASRFDPTLAAFRARLQDSGKPPKLAITACARKLLTIINAMARDATDYASAVS